MTGVQTCALPISVRLHLRAGGLLSMRGATILGVAVTLLVVVARVQTYFAAQIEGLLGKSVTMTGRTELWDAAILSSSTTLFLMASIPVIVP